MEVNKMEVVKTTKSIHVIVDGNEFVRSEGVLSNGEKFIKWNSIFVPDITLAAYGSDRMWKILEDMYQRDIVEEGRIEILYLISVDHPEEGLFERKFSIRKPPFTEPFEYIRTSYTDDDSVAAWVYHCKSMDTFFGISEHKESHDADLFEALEAAYRRWRDTLIQ